MDDTEPIFRHMENQEIVDLEHATGLLVAHEEGWSPKDYNTVIAYWRRKALLPPAFTPKPKRERLSCCEPARV